MFLRYVNRVRSPLRFCLSLGGGGFLSQSQLLSSPPSPSTSIAPVRYSSDMTPNNNKKNERNNKGGFLSVLVTARTILVYGLFGSASRIWSLWSILRRDTSKPPLPKSPEFNKKLDKIKLLVREHIVKQSNRSLVFQLPNSSAFEKKIALMAWVQGSFFNSEKLFFP